MLDTFEVILDPAVRARWSEGGCYKPAEVRINGRPLLELIKAAEKPWVDAENSDTPRSPEAESAPTLPGDYLYLPAWTVLLPSREWFGSPTVPGFVLEPGDRRRSKAMVLGCTCGISECWFVQARIDVGEDVVRWSEFGQFHRPNWNYALGPFSFDRRAYEAQLARGQN